MTAELGDAHTRVLSAKQYRSIKAKQAFTLGLDVAVLDQESGQESGQKLGQELIVTGVAQDSSAQAAGIAKGDKLLLIDGEDALDWWYRHGQVVRKNSTERAKLSSLKRLLNIGDPDHPSDAVELKIERKDGSFFEQKLVRTLLSRKDSVNALVLPSGFGYLRLTGFDAQLANAVQRAFKILQFTPGLIIDLRGNSGGSEALSFAMMDELLAGPVKVGKHVTRNGKPPSLFFGMIAVSKLDLVLEGSERPYTAPVVVLLDAGSASASELFAGTLQGMGRVSVIGQTSCGCLLVYYGYANVPGGGALAYSESDFAPVYGQRIEGRGVLPDIAVVNRRADLLAGRDQVLLTAEKFLDQKRSEKSAALSLMNLPNLN
jgi:carboxyl-terminal processing protease